jgi:hypothetical protein
MEICICCQCKELLKYTKEKYKYCVWCNTITKMIRYKIHLEDKYFNKKPIIQQKVDITKSCNSQYI